jgi:hypothetical protein
MTTTEMTKRLATIPFDTFCRAVEYVTQGYGAQGVKHVTGLTLAQVNAVFTWCDKRTR